MEKIKKIGFVFVAFSFMYAGAGFFQCGLSDYCSSHGSFGQMVTKAASATSTIEGSGRWAGVKDSQIIIVSQSAPPPPPPPPPAHSH